MVTDIVLSHALKEAYVQRPPLMTVNVYLVIHSITQEKVESIQFLEPNCFVDNVAPPTAVVLEECKSKQRQGILQQRGLNSRINIVAHLLLQHHRPWRRRANGALLQVWRLHRLFLGKSRSNRYLGP